MVWIGIEVNSMVCSLVRRGAINGTVAKREREVEEIIML